MKDYITRDIGSFEIKSGKVIVSDPCYGRGTWCQGTLDNVKKGKWNSKILTVDGRVAALIASHESILNLNYIDSYSGIISSFVVGVDSGQAGIFDLPEFHSDDDDYDDPESWYRRCCELTLKTLAGIIDNSGVVSSSGYGDGGYDCKTLSKDNEVVGIMIDFGLMEEEEDGEEENGI